MAGNFRINEGQKRKQNFYYNILMKQSYVYHHEKKIMRFRFRTCPLYVDETDLIESSAEIITYNALLKLLRSGKKEILVLQKYTSLARQLQLAGGGGGGSTLAQVMIVRLLLRNFNRIIKGLGPSMTPQHTSISKAPTDAVATYILMKLVERSQRKERRLEICFGQMFLQEIFLQTTGTNDTPNTICLQAFAEGTGSK